MEYKTAKEAFTAGVKKELDELHELFTQHYNRLDDLAEQALVPQDYHFMISQFDNNMNDFAFGFMISVFNAYRGDFISSDREVAAFMYALIDTIKAEQEQEEQETA